MRAVRRILVAVKDPLEKSLPSVTKATQLARAWGAKIELFHGLDVPLYVGTTGRSADGFRGIARELKIRSLEQLEVIAAGVGEQGVQVTTAAEWDFPIYEAIVRRAKRIAADLIVAEGSKRSGRLSPLLLRLTDWELLRLSAVPVLVVKSATPYRHPAILAAIDPLHARAKPSGLDDEILNAGAAIQRALRGKLHVVHAYVHAVAGIASYEILNADVVARLQEQVKANAQAGFEGALRKVKIPRTRRHLVGRHPKDAIPHVARKTKSAIVVMGAISRSGLKRLFIGNTAEQLLDDLTCDVLVVKPREFENRVPAAMRGPRFIGPQSPTPFSF